MPKPPGTAQLDIPVDTDIARFRALKGHGSRIAVLYDAQLAKDRAYEWIGRALADGAESLRSVRRARSVARHGIAVYSENLRAWLEAQPPRHRYAQVVAAMWEELLEFEDWDEQRRARFWLE